MSKISRTIEIIKQQGVLPLFYHDDAEVCMAVAKALYAAGIRLMEFTNRGENAEANFKYLVDERDKQLPGMLLAIGTIKNAKDAKRFIKLGADCVISPGIVKEIGEKTNDEGLLWIPGCMTATEIMQAEASGAKSVKLFPGHLLGPGFMSAIRELFPAMNFMPTGGVEVNRDNLKAWFDAGVCAVGIGSKLISNEILIDRKYGDITQLAKDAMGIISELRLTQQHQK